MNRQIKRALGTVAALSLGFAGFVGAAAPAQADASTTFKIHLNVPSSETAQWNIWFWGLAADLNSDKANNTFGDSTVGGVTFDRTPNFSHDDAYGSYAEFTIPASVTALNNVMRTTESWDGQEAVAEVPADGDTPAVPAVPAIAASDKPFGGDNIFPAGESWWNVGTQKREFPTEYKVHLNVPLKTALAQGWNLYSWGSAPPLLDTYNYTVTTTKKVGKKMVTKKTKVYPYRGKIPAAEDQNNHGWPFVGEDAYGAYAIVKVFPAYAGGVGLIPRRGNLSGAWKLQSGNFDADHSNGLGTATGTDLYISLGSSESSSKAPTFVGRYGATASYANGKLTVTPVRPSYAGLKGAYPTSIVVTAKKGPTKKTCTIATTATKSSLDGASWGLAESCDMDIVAGDTAATWEIYVQASSSGVGTGPGATDKANAKISIGGN
jgi:hypothetical protein